MRLSFLLLFQGLFLAGCLPASTETSELGEFVDWLLEDGERLESVRFAEVVKATSGHVLLPVDPEDPVDAAMLDALALALAESLVAFESGAHPVHGEGRINEVSRHFEDALLMRLNAVEGLNCGIPRTESGEAQRSGYPDLRLEHEASGRVFYLDPKVFKAGSEDSSFRTFYFEPKRETNKILEDASHLTIGVAHRGKQGERWRFEGWRIVDLSEFRVRLKAEFQASNRELYREDAVLRSEASADSSDSSEATIESKRRL